MFCEVASHLQVSTFCDILLTFCLRVSDSFSLRLFSISSTQDLIDIIVAMKDTFLLVGTSFGLRFYKDSCFCISSVISNNAVDLSTSSLQKNEISSKTGIFLLLFWLLLHMNVMKTVHSWFLSILQICKCYIKSAMLRNCVQIGLKFILLIVLWRVS